MVSADLPIPDAPADLAVVREFVNTTDRETDTDDLTTPAELTDYLRRAGLLTGGTPSDPGRPRAGARAAVRSAEGAGAQPRRR